MLLLNRSYRELPVLLCTISGISHASISHFIDSLKNYSDMEEKLHYLEYLLKFFFSLDIVKS
ncbi:hypothetical protein GECvBN5_gp099 [Salmonella phage GEC_vB_N5]|uniref:Uncharacterized protein n=3 Tax=Markadamsvirinae TaxID=2732013 RepID=A0A7S9ST23_9CAUD|nr:hypothetical protein GECvBN3_gp102 [Salmonella phage GEC_vB_N3]QPI15115.1 hypothetical protein GECvBN5_gp099 [Salmonella phage GEC_vB_N5]QPI15544.1 hypothetical protein GECvBN7_gp101 [Salmonella phage GEC_vB_N7]